MHWPERASGKNNIFLWLTTLVSIIFFRADIVWVALCHYSACTWWFSWANSKRGINTSMITEKKKHLIRLQYNHIFGGVPAVVSLTEFHIIQGLLAFISFYILVVFEHHKKQQIQMSSMFYGVVQQRQQPSMLVSNYFPNDMDAEIYVTDELGCGHCSRKGIKCN